MLQMNLRSTELKTTQLVSTDEMGPGLTVVAQFFSPLLAEKLAGCQSLLSTVLSLSTAGSQGSLRCLLAPEQGS